MGVISSVLFLTAVSAPSTPPAIPIFSAQRGDEWVYQGWVRETLDRPDVRYRRRHEIEVRLLVVNTSQSYTDYALLTLLRRADDNVSVALPAVSGLSERETPPAARLELIRRYPDGSTVLLVPPASLPLSLTERTPVMPLPMLELETFSPTEFAVVPPLGWKQGAPEFLNGESCVPVCWFRQSPNWDRPIGGQTAVQVREISWLSTQDGSVRRHSRSIEHRDGFRINPSLVIETEIVLQIHAKLGAKEWDLYRRDVEFAYALDRELTELTPQSKKWGPKAFEARLSRCEEYLNENPTRTPYREAIHSVRRRLAAAAQGEAAPILKIHGRSSPTDKSSLSTPPFRPVKTLP